MMPVWKQDVEDELAALDGLLARVPSAGSTAQRSLRQ